MLLQIEIAFYEKLAGILKTNSCVIGTSVLHFVTFARRKCQKFTTISSPLSAFYPTWCCRYRELPLHDSILQYELLKVELVAACDAFWLECIHTLIDGTSRRPIWQHDYCIKDVAACTCCDVIWSGNNIVHK